MWILAPLLMTDTPDLPIFSPALTENLQESPPEFLYHYTGQDEIARPHGQHLIAHLGLRRARVDRVDQCQVDYTLWNPRAAATC